LLLILHCPVIRGGNHQSEAGLGHRRCHILQSHLGGIIFHLGSFTGKADRGAQHPGHLFTKHPLHIGRAVGAGHAHHRQLGLGRFLGSDQGEPGLFSRRRQIAVANLVRIIRNISGLGRETHRGMAHTWHFFGKGALQVGCAIGAGHAHNRKLCFCLRHLATPNYKNQPTRRPGIQHP
jgi:hypothetical protein